MNPIQLPVNEDMTPTQPSMRVARKMHAPAKYKGLFSPFLVKHGQSHIIGVVSYPVGPVSPTCWCSSKW